MKSKKILVMEATGFIWSNLSKRLLKEASNLIVGYDSLNGYYVKENK